MLQLFLVRLDRIISLEYFYWKTCNDPSVRAILDLVGISSQAQRTGFTGILKA